MKNINKVLLIIISIFIVLYITTIVILNNRTKTIFIEPKIETNSEYIERFNNCLEKLPKRTYEDFPILSELVQYLSFEKR